MHDMLNKLLQIMVIIIITSPITITTTVFVLSYCTLIYSEDILPKTKLV